MQNKHQNILDVDTALEQAIALEEAEMAGQDNVTEIALLHTPLIRPLLSWETADMWKAKRGIAWYTCMGTLFAGLFFYAIATSAWTMGAALIAAATLFCVGRIKTPHMISVKVSEYGIQIGKTLWGYNTFETFWITMQPPHPLTLTLRRKKHLLPDLVIDLGRQDPLAVREYLATRLPEWTDKEVTLLDSLSHLFH